MSRWRTSVRRRKSTAACGHNASDAKDQREVECFFSNGTLRFESCLTQFFKCSSAVNFQLPHSCVLQEVCWSQSFAPTETVRFFIGAQRSGPHGIMMHCLRLVRIGKQMLAKARKDVPDPAIFHLFSSCMFMQKMTMMWSSS